LVNPWVRRDPSFFLVESNKNRLRALKREGDEKTGASLLQTSLNVTGIESSFCINRFLSFSVPRPPTPFVFMAPERALFNWLIILSLGWARKSLSLARSSVIVG